MTHTWGEFCTYITDIIGVQSMENHSREDGVWVEVIEMGYLDRQFIIQSNWGAPYRMQSV